MAKSKSEAQPPLSQQVPGEALPTELLGVQAEAVTEQEPKPAPLIRLPEPSGQGFMDQPPVPPVASPTPAPRFIHQNHRAPAGMARVKVRAVNYGEQPMRYVLVPAGPQAVEAAKAHYMRATGLDAVVEAQQGEGPKVRLAAKPLPD